MRRSFILIFLLFFITQTSCGVYSFTGASIQGKTINIRVLENRAQNVVPTLSATLTDKIRTRILSQTGLAPQNNESTDYDISGAITMYQVTVSGVQNTQQASQNRLTVSVQINFKNRLDEKASFNQTFTRFADFSATQTLQAAEAGLIQEIGNQLADDIFNKAFVNW
ncbi:MAG TPA: LPS assembly lipoprotein LptE [Flavipsychrobacter sp.]|nr:LPS assembly lipoprotein LptE [Flavipsychrobacter sp.]